MTSISTKCGQVKRRLKQDEPLEGEILEFALSIVEGSDDALLVEISRKLRVGEELDEYEHHILVDVLLLHVKLGAA